MNRYVTRGVVGTRALVRAARSEQLTFIAASLAYYAFVSLFPLLLLSLVAASVFGGPRFADAVADRATATVAPVAGELVRDTLGAADVRGQATLVGLVLLGWTGLKVFRGLDIAFSQVYGVDTDESFLQRVIDALTALFAVAAGIAIVVVAGAVGARTGLRFGGVLAMPALAVGLLGALLPLYYLFPDTDVTVREAVPGAAFAAVCWTVLGTVFTVYAAGSVGFTGYGIVGAILLLLTWFYVGSVVLLLGAVANAVLAGRLTEEEIQTVYAVGGEQDCPHGERRTTPVGPSDGSKGSSGRDRAGGPDPDADGDPDPDPDPDPDADGDADADADPDPDADPDANPDADADPDADGDPDPDADADPNGGQDGSSAGGSGPEPDLETDGGADRHGGGAADPAGAADESGTDREVADLREQVRDLRSDLREFEDDVDDRTVHRDEIERDLQRYVRRRIRRGHARGWGPYLVLLYGTAMTLGAFYYLSSGWAILAMIVIWLSTLGLYALMLVVGAILNLAGVSGRFGAVAGRVWGRVRGRR